MSLHRARKLLSGLALLATLTVQSHASALEVPPLRGRVNDLAGLIPGDQARALEERLARFEKETSHQIAVLTIPSLEGEALEGFSIRVAESWKIGKKGFDNGVILLIVRNDRKLRVEVGYGLEGILPDAIASRIVREVIVPRFRANDFAGGIEAGVEAIMKATRGEVLPIPERTGSVARRNDFPFVALLVFVIITLFLASLFTEAERRRPQRLLWGSGIGAAMGILAGIYLGAIGAGLGLVITLLVIGTVIGALVAEGRPSDGWSGGGRRRYGGTLGGGFGGGGGFSGGGGGFGGGGASGSW